MLAQGKLTTDRNFIIDWVRSRHGLPARISKITNAGIEKILSIHFPDCQEDVEADPISWEEFFDNFDQNHYVFIYQDKDRSGKPSRDFALM